jgi:uncharacterized membrane protein (UPF0127 family)
MAVTVLVSPVACGDSAGGALPTGTVTFTTVRGPVRMTVEIAETVDARRRGLMDRTSLAADSGMVFLFDEPEDGAFWMKDTSIPLSIAFFGEDRRILAVLDMEPCRSEPCPLYSPGAEYTGAVEANRGYFDAHGISEGDRVELTR